MVGAGHERPQTSCGRRLGAEEGIPVFSLNMSPALRAGGCASEEIYLMSSCPGSLTHPSCCTTLWRGPGRGGW